jgi:hypothetical protein
MHGAYVHLVLAVKIENTTLSLSVYDDDESETMHICTNISASAGRVHEYVRIGGAPPLPRRARSIAVASDGNDGAAPATEKKTTTARWRSRRRSRPSPAPP